MYLDSANSTLNFVGDLYDYVKHDAKRYFTISFDLPAAVWEREFYRQISDFIVGVWIHDKQINTSYCINLPKKGKKEQQMAPIRKAAQAGR